MSYRLCAKTFTMFCLVVLMFFTLLGTGHAGVLGYWGMDDSYPPGYFTRTTADGSGNGNDGILTSTLSVGEVVGYDGVGTAANFYSSDPAAMINCGTDPSIKPTSAGYSFATWVRFDNLDSTWQLIGSDWNDSGTAGAKYFYHFGMLKDSGTDLLTLYLGEPGTDNISLYAFTGVDTPIVADSWMHVGFTITPGDGTNPGEVILYRDGVRAAPIADYNFTSLPYTNEPVILGAKTTAGSLPLHGQLDATAVWSSAISEADFGTLAGGASPTTVSASTLGGFWDYETIAPPAPTTATVVDGSINGHDGVFAVRGAEPFSTGGRFGGAIALSSTSGHYVNVGDIDGTTEAMTVAAWIKPTNPNSFGIVASQSDDGNDAEWAWQIYIASGKAYFYVYNPDWDGTSPDSFLWAGTATGITGDWNHVAMTMTSNDGAELGEVAIYLNGVQVGTPISYDMESLLDSSTDIIFGNKAGGLSSQAFNGLMDDFILLDEALSPEDIAYLYTHPGSDLLLIPGDANKDGFVDGSDATILANYWQYGVGDPDPDATWEMGDFNGDHVVDGSDATLLASHWQEGTPPPGAVPEPSTLVLLLAAAAGLFLVRRK